MESPSKSIVFVVVCFVCYSAALELLVLPEGEEHSVLCTVADEDRYLIDWLVNGGSAGEEFVVGDEETLQDGMKGTKITFNATLDVNNTNVMCTILDRVTPALSFDSLNFTIIIQGLLSAPDVDYTIMEDGSIQFIWSPPFSHNITDVEPDISHYLVTIINMEDHSVLTVNTTDTQYLLQSQDCQLSHYQVEIAAVNVVGVGDKDTSPNFTLDELVISDTVTVYLGMDSPVIDFQVHTSCHIVHLDINLTPRFSDQTIHVTRYNVSNEETTLNITSPDIRFNEYYMAIVSTDGVDSFSHNLKFSTFDVQNVSIVPNREGQYEITCVFAPGSQSKGCRIVIMPEGRGGDCELNITARRPEGGLESVVNVDLPAAGEYSLVVYDDELVTQENPAFTTSLSIPGSTPEAGCVFDMKVESTNDSEENNLALAMGIVIGIAVISAASVVAVIFAIKYRGRKTAVGVKLSTSAEHSTADVAKDQQEVSLEKASEESSPSEEGKSQPCNAKSSASDDQTHTTNALSDKYVQVELNQPDVQRPPEANENVVYSAVLPRSSPSQEGGSHADSNTVSIHSTTVPDKGNYVQVQLDNQPDVRRPPEPNQEVVYSTVLPQKTTP